MLATNEKSGRAISASGGQPEMAPAAPTEARPPAIGNDGSLEPAAASASRFVSETGQSAPLARADRSAGALIRAWFSRPRRILFAIGAIWILTIVDLVFTLQEWGAPHFGELNPIAVRILSHSSTAVVLFKFGMVGLATAILLALRRTRLAELACWLLLAVLLNVGLAWWHYFKDLAEEVDTYVILGP